MSLFFTLIIISIIFLVAYIYNAYRIEDPIAWLNHGNSNAYNIYYNLVKEFGKPNTMVVGENGYAEWNESNLSENDFAKNNNLSSVKVTDRLNHVVDMSFHISLSVDDYNNIKKKYPSLRCTYDFDKHILNIQDETVQSAIDDFNKIKNIK